MDLSTPLTYVKGVGPARGAMLETKGLITVEDLLAYVPFRYEDRSNTKAIAQLAPGEMATVVAEVHSARLAGFRRRNLGLFEASFRDSSHATLRAKWFHGEYLAKTLAPGKRVALFGKVEFDSYTGELTMLHPEFELLTDEDDDAEAALHVGRVVPVYEVAIQMNGAKAELDSGAVVIAAITSCTNTSNPSVMVAAGLLAKKAAERGLKSKPWVKTSLAPGSKVVSDYLAEAGLMPYLEKLNFHLVGYGCTTCIGNSGPLPEPVAQAVQKENMVVAAVLSGNRNFEGRINALVKANYLASPPLVVAYALAGRVDVDLQNEPLGQDDKGAPVYLREIWPATAEIDETIRRAVRPDMFRHEYEKAFEGDTNWKSLPTPAGTGTFTWDEHSTYIKKPPYFDNMVDPGRAIEDLAGMRVLALLGDSVTTDHISPAGSIPAESPAGRYLIAQGVKPADFNSYGARRGNHEVMVRGTLANIRLRNQLAPGTEGGWTLHLPVGEQMSIYDASVQYQQEGVPLMIIAGKEYGSGSSRDWAAKGVLLLGVKAVLAESFERIHRTNLVGMGVLPLQFSDGENAQSLKLTGKESYSVKGISKALSDGSRATVRAADDEGMEKRFEVQVRVDTPQEAEYFRNGGILPYVLRQLAATPVSA